jgi:hypothetical protein
MKIAFISGRNKLAALGLYQVPGLDEHAIKGKWQSYPVNAPGNLHWRLYFDKEHNILCLGIISSVTQEML